jgi:hypothetical protein
VAREPRLLDRRNSAGGPLQIEQVFVARPTGVGRAISTYTCTIPDRGPRRVAGCGRVAGMMDGLRGEPPMTRTARQVDVLAAFVASGGSVPDAAGTRRHSAQHRQAPLGGPTSPIRPHYRAAHLPWACGGLARRAEPRARLRWGAESVRPAARRSPAKQASSAVGIPGSTTSTPERPCTTTVWFWSSLRWTATPSAAGVSTRRLPTRADSQADEQLVQLVERLGIPARRPGRDGLVQRLL